MDFFDFIKEGIATGLGKGVVLALAAFAVFIGDAWLTDHFNRVLAQANIYTASEVQSSKDDAANQRLNIVQDFESKFLLLRQDMTLLRDDIKSNQQLIISEIRASRD